MLIPDTFVRLTLLAAIAGPLSAQERQIPESQLPPRVATAMAREAQGNKVLRYTREVDSGQTFYELSLQLPAGTRDVLMDTLGTIVEVEESVAFDSLPAAVQGALRARSGGQRLGVIERLIKRGRLVAYEAHVGARSQAREIQVGPAGEALDHEE